MDTDSRWYCLGLALGMTLGVACFLIGCPFTTCVEPSLRMSAQQQRMGSL
jgi:hypothetical protein